MIVGGVELGRLADLPAAASGTIPEREGVGVDGCGSGRCLSARRGSCKGLQGSGDVEEAVPWRRRKLCVAELGRAML